MTYTAPAIHTALAAILKSLSVEKNGQLPGNMGGKSYITATDLNSEAKRKFVEHNLVLIPNEKVIKYEAQSGTRLQILVAIEGTYTLISTVDGSIVEFGGVGDGVATGSAVASNIASTNALKNALLRLFLVTEQSVEDAAKAGSPEADEKSPAQSKITKAAGGAKASAPAAGKSEVSQLQNQIRDYAKDVASSTGVPATYYQAVGKRLFPDAGASWMTDAPSLSKVLAELKAGATE